MADLTMLDVELAEVLGLAQAAQVATRRVATLARKEEETELLQLMSRMAEEAAQVEQRCDAVAGTREGMKTAIVKRARRTEAEVTTFMKTYLAYAKALDGLEFLSMTEAGEMAHWKILAKLNETADDRFVASVVTFALPLLRRTSMLSASTRCAWPRPRASPSRSRNGKRIR